MATVVIIGLIVAVIALFWIAVEQGYTISKYEQELMQKSKKGKRK